MTGRPATALRLGIASLALAATLLTIPLAGCAGARGQGGARAKAARPRAAASRSAGGAGGGAGSLRTVDFHSLALGRTDRYLVYLPPGYERAARLGHRFPVLYLLHGDGIAARHTAAHMFVEGGIGPTLSHLVDAGRIQPFIVVMPEAADGTPAADTEWANTADGAFAAEVLDLVKAVDSRWATVPDRSGRAIAGLSMGGYGAVNIGLRNLPLFSVLESWSGYFTQTRSGVYAGASPAALRAASPQGYVRRLGPSLRSFPVHVLLYGGIGDPLLRQQAPFAAALRSLGVAVRTAKFHGPHDYSLWSGHMQLALEYASRNLSPRP